ncbi:MAG: phosphate/phosphite/phosphonate ABC transporter substrate-binding protein [Nitrospirae bacterium]|nr:phosphate/phosphite/phosphonate ABC transporter substrate-binding protein [Nitrospirota bacterium]
MKKVHVLVVMVGLMLFMPVLSDAQQQKEILIGLIPEMNVFKQQERFKPLTEYLTKKTGVKVNITILSRYGNIIERFTAEKMDGAFFGSFTGALAIEKLGVDPIARPVNLDGSSTYHGYLFVRKDNGIKNVSDMKGKKMAFVEKATTAGFIFPVAYLKQNGINDYKSFFKEFYFSGSHDASIFAVLDKKADIGAAKHSIYDRVRKNDPRVDKDLLIIAESAKVPSNGLCVRKGLDLDLKNRFKKALLNIDKDPDGKAVLEKFGALKFIETTKEDYKTVSMMAKDAGINMKTYVYKNE